MVSGELGLEPRAHSPNHCIIIITICLPLKISSEPALQVSWQGLKPLEGPLEN